MDECLGLFTGREPSCELFRFQIEQKFLEKRTGLKPHLAQVPSCQEGSRVKRLWFPFLCPISKKGEARIAFGMEDPQNFENATRACPRRSSDQPFDTGQIRAFQARNPVDILADMDEKSSFFVGESPFPAPFIEGRARFGVH